MATARQRPNMASLLREELLEARGQAPAPSKDFCQLLVTRRQVIFRWWKISLRSEFRDARPGEIKESHEDFLDDSSLHSNYDFLERLPVPLLLYIISFLELEDIARLSQVSHRFKMVMWPKISSKVLLQTADSSRGQGCTAVPKVCLQTCRRYFGESEFNRAQEIEDSVKRDLRRKWHDRRIVQVMNFRDEGQMCG
ncbi:F-box only protein 36 isoform X3 [Apteryx rowi]|uniref:F-box only protein 36 isoform X3 n=1 Tax=Apteryx rowi TaxID=308060 RepID=UPI000E1DF360|nr:F-box only protein 36 isoform X3 [Apteryx rowi]